MKNFIEIATNKAETFQAIGSIQGHAAHAAMAELIANWSAAAADGASAPDLAHDLRDVAALLNEAADALSPASATAPAATVAEPDTFPALPKVEIAHTYVIGSKMPDGTISDDWDSRLASAGASPIISSARIIARFHPQNWVGDLTAPADPEGPVEWDVTDEIYRMGREAARKLRDDQPETDALRDLPSAPVWIRNWSGPFYVEVQEAIEAFYSPLS